MSKHMFMCFFVLCREKDFFSKAHFSENNPFVNINMCFINCVYLKK